MSSDIVITDETVGGAGGEMSSEPVALNTASGQQEVNPLVTEHPVTIATSPGSILQQVYGYFNIISILFNHKFE